MNGRTIQIPSPRGLRPWKRSSLWPLVEEALNEAELGRLVKAAQQPGPRRQLLMWQTDITHEPHELEPILKQLLESPDAVRAGTHFEEQLDRSTPRITAP